MWNFVLVQKSTSDESIIDKTPVKKDRGNGGGFKNADGEEVSLSISLF